MSERRVELNLGQAALTPDGEAADSDRRKPADDVDRQRFEQAMEGGRPSRPEPAAASRADSPFALFGGTVATPRQDEQAKADGPSAEWQAMLDRLMVGEGQGGGKLVRMALAEEILPGVSVSVSEEGGAWLVEFECRNDDIREHLCGQARPLALEMASRLQRDTLWRVMTDDPEDRRPFEVRACVGGDAA